VIPQIEKTGKVTQGYLGITTIDVDPALRLAASPLEPWRVDPDDPERLARGPSRAASGGLLATLPDGITQVQEGGDIITAVDGHQISGATALENAVLAQRPGRVVTLSIVRGSKHMTVRVRLGTRPDVLAVS